MNTIGLAQWFMNIAFLIQGLDSRYYVKLLAGVVSFETGERCHEGYHVSPAADEQREYPAELGAPVHEAVQSGQRPQLHHQLDRWARLQCRAPPA